jgi:hypothetical protein
VSQPNSPTELANKYGRDKGSAVRLRHNHTALYDLILAPLRLYPIRLLEIGLAVGGPEGGGPIKRVANAPSIAMWLEYFPHAEIHGFDISDFSHVRHPRFRLVQGDLGSYGDLARLAATATQFDIIIDDGSHASYHQQLALSCLFRRLALGGLYVIEGPRLQPAAFQAALPAAPKTATLLHDARVRQNDVGSTAQPVDRLRAIRQWTQSCALFASFCDDGFPRKLAVLHKRNAAAEQEADTLPTVRSFDLFDTLVARPGFAADRIAAEAKLHGAPYTLDDIYRRLIQDTGISDADAGRLRCLKLTVEREMLCPIAQHCAEFAASDIVVPDMYLPVAFLQELVSRTCRLPARRLFVSAEGKRNGTIWPIVHGACTPVEHVGDSPATDLWSARAVGIPARLNTIARRTAIEGDPAFAGYEPLANLIREARLRTWPANEMERHLQPLQIQANFPLLFGATLALVNISDQRGWRRILLSPTDGNVGRANASVGRMVSHIRRPNDRLFAAAPRHAGAGRYPRLAFVAAKKVVDTGLHRRGDSVPMRQCLGPSISVSTLPTSLCRPSYSAQNLIHRVAGGLYADRVWRFAGNWKDHDLTCGRRPTVSDISSDRRYRTGDTQRRSSGRGRGACGL